MTPPPNNELVMMDRLIDTEPRIDFMSQFQSPPREFGVMPFWFLNDDLDEGALLRQIADFDAHGVCGFVLHARVGLPRHLGFMSPVLLDPTFPIWTCPATLRGS